MGKGRKASNEGKEYGEKENGEPQKSEVRCQKK
jgi:hypothetical protein